MKKLIALLVSALVTSPVLGALSVEAVSANTTGKIAGAGTTVTISFTVTSANLLLVGIGVGFNDAGTDPLTVVTGITYNGVAMSAVSGSDSDNDSFEGVRWYSLATPDTGTHNVVATVNDAGAQVGIGIISFIDASSTLGTPSVNTNTTVDPSVTVVDSANGNIVVSALATDGSSGATTAAGTNIADIEDIDNDSDFNFQYQTASGASTVASWTNSTADGWATGGLAVLAASGVVLEQEGFRWGVDDANEVSHTFEAAQDTNISIADNQSRLLRTLVNATLDPANTAYTLRYQKNGSGGYVAVPVGSTTAFSITNQNVAASSDDAQEQGGTVTLTGTTIGASLDATTEWVGMRFTNITIPAGATITSASVGVVPSGTGEDEPLVTVFLEAADDCAAFTTGASNISGRSRTTGVSWSSTDLGASGSSYHSTPDLTTDFQAVVNRAGWASGNDVCVLIQGGSTATRDLTIEAQDLGPNTNPPRLSVAWTTPNQVYVTTSANITASGEATTARLTAPSGKTTSDFVTGRRWDDENGTDSIDITTDDYTEVEWLVFIASSAADGDFFDFRTYAGASPLDTYTVTPRWTIPGGASGLLLSRRRAFH